MGATNLFTTLPTPLAGVGVDFAAAGVEGSPLLLVVLVGEILFVALIKRGRSEAAVLDGVAVGGLMVASRLRLAGGALFSAPLLSRVELTRMSPPLRCRVEAGSGESPLMLLVSSPLRIDNRDSSDSVSSADKTLLSPSSDARDRL